MKIPNVIDLFAGGWGLHLAFKNQGFNVCLSSDIDQWCEKTHRHNYPDVPFLRADIREINARHIWSTIGRKVSVDLVVGGPPCQGFSTIGNRASSDPKKRAKIDERNYLFKEYVRVISQIKPKYVLMENVKGILTAKENGEYFIEKVIREFKRIGYKNLDYKVLNAADYGVPQIRNRVVIIANRVGKPISFPIPTHSANGLNGKKFHTNVVDAIGDLNGKEGKLPNHDAMNHGWKNIQRYKLIPEGGRLPEHKLSAEIYRRNFGNTFKRLHRNKPALTMVPGHSGFPIHPTKNRSLTIREAARIQTFPDEIILFGSRTQQGMQIGNAVPVKFAEALAAHLKDQLLGS